MSTQAFMEKIGCRLPLIQAPMAGTQHARLAIAVCQAGALGSLPASMLSPGQLVEGITAIRQAVNAPFNVNFFAHQQPELDQVAQDKWLQTLMPYYQEFDIDVSSIGYLGGRQPFTQTQADIVSELKPPVVSFHFGLPAAPLLQQVKQSGAVVMASATTIEEALWLEQRGVDVIIAQGLEAGGHRSMFLTQDLTTQLGTFSLLPQICAAVRVPVVAAGGISNAITAHAAMELGASAVQAGTAFLLADEADTKPAHRVALQSSRAEKTAVTNLFSGGYARGIVNRFIAELGPVCDVAPPFPLAQAAVTPLKNAAEAQGTDEFSSLWAGQNAPLAKAGRAAEIVQRIAQGLMVDEQTK